MVRYFYAWTPLVVVFGTVILLSSPYLALIVLMLVTLGVVAALVWAIAAVPVLLSRAIRRRRRDRSGARERAAAALATGVGRTRPVPVGATVLHAGASFRKGEAT
jgi:hypothetical protein